MAKKRPVKKAAKSTKSTVKKSHAEHVVFSPSQEKAIKLVDKSVKICGELEDALKSAAAKVVRKCMKEHGIQLSAAEADLLTLIWFE